MELVPAGDLAGVFGLGVAGNFAGHLEQAGEAVDFVSVEAPAAAPKGIFPWFVPGGDGFLGVFPLSSDSLLVPESDHPLNLQIEPEAGVLCRIEYAEGEPVRLAPELIGAFNDCSVRRPDAQKISEKKNWGACSKGFAARAFPVDEIDPGGATANLRIACFLRRGSDVFEYGVDSPVATYTFYGERLLDWITERLREQRGGDTPLEDVGALLRSCGSPERMLVGVGATRYTEFGESNFLEPGDESVVVLYDGSVLAPADVAAATAAGTESSLPGSSVLTQLVH